MQQQWSHSSNLFDRNRRSARSTLRGLIAAYQGRTTASLQLLHQALKHLPREHHFWRGLAAGVLALNHVNRGDLPRARDALLHALDVAEQTGGVMNSALALCRLGELAVLDCRLDDAQHRYEDARARATRNGRPLPIAGMADMGFGLLQLERGELEAAISHLEHGIKLIHAWGDSGAIQGELWLAAAYTLRGDWAYADEALHRARQLATTFDVMTMDDHLVEWQQVDLWLAKGDRESTVAWLERQLAPSQWPLPPGEEITRPDRGLLAMIKTVTMARICLVDGRPEMALSLLASLAARTDQPMPSRLTIDARLIEALALHSLQRPFEARQRLTDALELAATSNIIRPFLTQGMPITELLSVADFPDSHLRTFATRLQTRLAMSSPASSLASPATQAVTPPRLESLLTARELEVLALVAAGATNREIATQLVISLSTVKTHINNIYRKLDVHTRTGALASAYQLGLL